MMTTTPDEPRPVQVHLIAETADYVAAMRVAQLVTPRTDGPFVPPIGGDDA